MLKLRVFLVLLAGGMVALLIQLSRLHANATPERLLELARDELEREEPDYDAAFRRVQRGVALAQELGAPELLREFALTRLHLHRNRWDRALTIPGQPQGTGDLEQVIELSRRFLEQFGNDDREVLELAARCSIDANLSKDALVFVRRLETVGRLGPAENLLRARAHTLAAEEELAELPRILEKRMSTGEAKRTYSIVREAAARPLDHPQRVAALDRLETKLPAEIASEVLERISTSSGHLSLASSYYQLVLRDEPSGRAVVGLQNILIDAQAHQKAVDLARLALARPDLVDEDLVIRSTVRCLLDSGRVKEAELLVDELLGAEEAGLDYALLPQDDLYSWCVLFLRLESWNPLFTASQAILKRNEEAKTEIDERQDEARFYTGLAASYLKHWYWTEAALTRVPSDGRELYPGMHMELHEALARAANAPRQRRERRALLVEATRAMPEVLENDRLRRTAGRAWFDLGKLLDDEQDPINAEHALTQALRFLPEERGSIEPLWEEVGERALVARGRTVRAVRWAPWSKDERGNYPPMGPWEACMRADSGLRSGQNVLDVTTLLQPILQKYPGFPRALQALARTEVLRDRHDRAILAELDLAESGQIHASGLQFLRTLPRDRFTGSQIRRWLSFDPLGAGFEGFLDGLSRDGRLGLLVETVLRAQRADDLTEGQALRAAQVCEEQGRPDLSHRLLMQLPPESALYARNADLALRVALRVSDLSNAPKSVHDMAARIDELADPLELRHARGLVHAADLALTTPFFDPLALVLDKALQAQRDDRGSLLIRLALVELRRERWDEALEAIDRAEAYLDDDSALVARLLLELDRGDAPGAVQEAEALLRSSFANSPMRRALLTAIAGDFVSSQDALGQVPATGTPQLPYLQALLRPRDGTDPARFVDPWSTLDLPVIAALFLATDTEDFASWGLSTLARLPDEARNSPTGTLLGALAWYRLGERDRAEQLLRASAEQEGEQAHWALLERLLRDRVKREVPGTRGPAYTSLLQLLSERMARFGRDGIPPVEAIMIDALMAIDDEARVRAILEQGTREHPDSFLLALELARVLDRPGQRLLALEHYERLFLAHYRASRPFVPEVVRLLRETLVAKELAPEAVWAQLDAFEALFPDEPSLPRELATMRLGLHGQKLDWSVQRAWDRLDRFRERTGNRPIESLRAGETEQWAALYQRFDPERAEAFARTELDQDPSSLALWKVWCDTLVGIDRRERALGVYDALVSVVPAPELQSARSVLRIDLGLPPGREAAMLLADEKGRERDPALALRCAIALLARGGGDQALAHEWAFTLWEDRARRNLSPSPSGRQLALAIAGSDPERALAILDEVTREVRDPLEKVLLNATRHLIALPLPEPEVPPVLTVPADETVVDPAIAGDVPVHARADDAQGAGPGEQ